MDREAGFHLAVARYWFQELECTIYPLLDLQPPWYIAISKTYRDACNVVSLMSGSHRPTTKLYKRHRILSEWIDMRKRLFKSRNSWQFSLYDTLLNTNVIEAEGERICKEVRLALTSGEWDINCDPISDNTPKEDGTNRKRCFNPHEESESEIRTENNHGEIYSNTLLRTNTRIINRETGAETRSHEARANRNT